MSTEVKFPKGIFFKAKRENAPDFVKGHISIKVDEAINFLRDKGKEGLEWVNLDLLNSKDGKLYLKVDEWKKDETSTNQKTEKDEDDLPF
tara:strand:- start:446 stop:715 length:270 start_codon:yes stop_codon:yes gene_type:complete